MGSVIYVAICKKCGNENQDEFALTEQGEPFYKCNRCGTITDELELVYGR